MQRDPDRPRDRPIGGRFWVDAELARTATGTLYLVRDGQDGPLLGLKACGADEPVLAKKRSALLEREFHALLGLAHASVMAAYEWGSDELGSFYTAEALAAPLPEGRLPWREACSVLADIAASLDVIHRHGMVHGAVSRHAIGRAPDGRAKLRDFGALCGIGALGAVIGSPASLAPELMQAQPLDARADLFSLGALAYSLLTGRDAYPARELEALRDVWRSALIAPARHEPELPRELDALVVRLMSLDRGRRPEDAAEVVLALTAIAELPEIELDAVAPRRLVCPRLVGRDHAHLEVRRCVLSLLAGTGGALIIEGAPGSGRSRLLDACVMEGKLLGATVVRANAGAGSRNDWAVARHMCLQLLPELATAFKGFPRHVLGRVIASVQGGEGAQGALGALDRDLVLRELRDFLLALTRGQRLVFAIDDVDHIDEPSAALLALLAQRADEHGLLVAVTAEPGAGTGHTSSAALKLLRAVSASLQLGALSGADVEALLRGSLGAAGPIEAVAKRLQRAAKGNARSLLELLQSFIDRGQLRRSGESWALHRDGSKAADTVDAALQWRLAQLSVDALELAVALVAAEGEPVGLADYARLTSHGSFARVVVALFELVSRRVLIMELDGYRFAHPGYSPLLSERLSEEAKRTVHRSLAQQLALAGHDPWRCARHLFDAGSEAAAVELLARVGVPAQPQSITFMQRVLAGHEEHAMPARFVHALRRVLLSAAIEVLDVETARAVLPKLVEGSERAAGLPHYREASGVPQPQRRDEAQARSQQLHDAASEAQRVQSPAEALRALVLLCVEGSELGLRLYDSTWFDMLPEFEPLAGFSAELDAVAELVAGAREVLKGRVLQAFIHYERAQARLEERSGNAAVEELRSTLRMSVRRQLGSVQADIGSREAEQHAQILEAQREFRVAAYRMRARMYVSRGAIAEARKWQRRYELLQLQHARQSPDVAGDAGFELLASAFAGDLPGIERGLVPVAELAERYPGWKGAWCLGECHRLWLQGDLEGAVDALGPVLEPSLAGRHPHWGHAAAVHVVLLCELDRAQDAVTCARSYERICHRLQAGLADRWLRQGLGYALGRSGKYAAASALLDPLIEQLEGLGVGGLPLGSAYEIRAKIALYAGDRAAFERAAQRCADAYFETGNPAMTGKVAQLAEEAAELESPALAEQ